MQFFEALTSKEKNKAIPEAFDYFGKLIGGWNIRYVDNNRAQSFEGEWYFSWILDGMAIQDVVILPDYEYGTTLRVYNPGTHAWDIAYCYTGNIMRLEARKQDGMIVLTHLGSDSRKWIFTDIEENKFHWQDTTRKDDGTWHVDFDIYAERR